ncbi:hypothetical protein, partial [Actinomyces qiguomingii]|uniref:hypothetical protein n=1 Tax=Actinomyces qiguomingii TaxID=2057800 RepID=UPI001E3CA88D
PGAAIAAGCRHRRRVPPSPPGAAIAAGRRRGSPEERQSHANRPNDWGPVMKCSTFSWQPHPPQGETA